MPSSGIFPANASTTDSETPASLGVQAPGEITILSGFSAAMPANSISSLHHLDVGLQLLEVLHHVIGEGVVVIDHQDSYHKILFKILMIELSPCPFRTSVCVLETAIIEESAPII